jgi:hypothetical protein
MEERLDIFAWKGPLGDEAVVFRHHGDIAAATFMLSTEATEVKREVYVSLTEDRTYDLWRALGELVQPSVERHEHHCGFWHNHRTNSRAWWNPSTRQINGDAGEMSLERARGMIAVLQAAVNEADDLELSVLVSDSD